jgi:hypothetical protein
MSYITVPVPAPYLINSRSKSPYGLKRMPILNTPATAVR